MGALQAISHPLGVESFVFVPLPLTTKSPVFSVEDAGVLCSLVLFSFQCSVGQENKIYVLDQTR